MPQQLVKDKAQGIVNAIAIDKADAEQRLEAARPALEQAGKEAKYFFPI